MKVPVPIVTFVDLSRRASTPRVRDLSAATFHGDDFDEDTIVPLSDLRLQPPAIPINGTIGPQGMEQRAPAVLQATHLVGKVLVCVWVAADMPEGVPIWYPQEGVPIP